MMSSPTQQVVFCIVVRDFTIDRTQTFDLDQTAGRTGAGPGHCFLPFGYCHTRLRHALLTKYNTPQYQLHIKVTF
ncbi:hypothetical protein F2P45_05815 [Massilia sp. CCM 8733]|uniref:Uncharacterized protein n=1 Tax=Massilia mucilaginosa TaxID=2609282 RepID=A0ABX0NP16_9BURK|nr:hypothetical protein [Massilia mucilaginosa]NHZ88541.1 hypothetical protein [Massilia mucilaginosa]